MLGFRHFGGGETIAKCESRGLSYSVCESRRISRPAAAQSLRFTQLKVLLRLPLCADWLDVGMMPYQHEEPDAVFQLAKSAPQGKLPPDRIALGRERIADSPMRPHWISGQIP